jgi:hypothetical protein
MMNLLLACNLSEIHPQHGLAIAEAPMYAAEIRPIVNAEEPNALANTGINADDSSVDIEETALMDRSTTRVFLKAVFSTVILTRLAPVFDCQHVQAFISFGIESVVHF